MPFHTEAKQGTAGQAEGDIAEMPPVRRPFHRRARLPAALIVFVVGAIATTVLSANGGRNIEYLKLAAGRTWIAQAAVTLGWAAGSPARPITAENSAALVAGSAPTKGTGRPAEGQDRTPTSGKVNGEALGSHPGLVSQMPAGRQMAGLTTEAAAQTCRRLGASRQEIPIFTSSDDGAWQCALLLTYESHPQIEGDTPASLFVQITGRRDMPFSTFRIKFNPGRAGMTAALADEAARLAGLALAGLALAGNAPAEHVPANPVPANPVAAGPVAAGLAPAGGNPLAGGAELAARLQSRSDFEMAVNGYRAVFKREGSDPTRGNLIIRNVPSGNGPAERTTLPAPATTGPAALPGRTAPDDEPRKPEAVISTVMAAGGDLVPLPQSKAADTLVTRGKSSRLGATFYDHP